MWRYLAALVVAACSGVAHTANGTDAMADPPPPPDVDLPTKYGDLPVRPPPQSRSSTWTVYGDGEPASWDVPCDARAVPALRDALNLMFQGTDAGDSPPPGEDVALLLEIRWSEDGSENARSHLYSDGSLLKVVGEERTVQRVLDEARLAGVAAQLVVASGDHACPEE